MASLTEAAGRTAAAATRDSGAPEELMQKYLALHREHQTLAREHLAYQQALAILVDAPPPTEPIYEECVYCWQTSERDSAKHATDCRWATARRTWEQLNGNR